MRVFRKDCVFSGTKKQAENGTKAAVDKLCVGSLSVFPPFGGRHRFWVGAAHLLPHPHQTCPAQAQGAGWKGHIARAQGNQLFHKLIQLKPAGHSEMFRAGRLFPLSHMKG